MLQSEDDEEFYFTFLHAQAGPYWEEAVHVMFPGFSFFTLEPEQDRVGLGEVGPSWEGEVVPG